MTVTAMAKQLNVSTMTIYRRCKKNGVNIEELRDGPNGELTPEGVSVIASMFDATTPQTAITDDATRMPHDSNDDAQTASQGTAAASMAVRVAELTATVDGLRALVDQLQGERDALREQLTAAQAALAAEQADRQSERRLLTGDSGEAGSRRRWRWPWARG